MLGQAQMTYEDDDIKAKGEAWQSHGIGFCAAIATMRGRTLEVWTAIPTMNDLTSAIQGDDNAVRKGRIPLQPSSTRQTDFLFWVKNTFGKNTLLLFLAHTTTTQ